MAEPYSEKVLDHFRNPRNVGEMENPDGIGHVGNPVCVTPETLIQTNNYIEEIKTIIKGCKVLGHDGRYHRVKSIHARNYIGKVYSIVTNNLGKMLVTPDHHILALKMGRVTYKFSEYKKFIPDWYMVDELEKGDVLLYPIPKETKDIKSIKLDIERPKWDFKSKALPEEIEVDNDFLRLAGYYLAEGYVKTDKCEGTVGFVFSSKESEYIDDVILLMRKKCGIFPRKITNRNKTALELRFYSARLARFFEKLFGKGVANKRIPQWMMRLPIEKQRSLLCGLWRGDGYIDPKRQRAKYVTISKQLAYQTELLFLRQKIISSFSKGRAKGIHKEHYLFYIQHDSSLKKISDIMGIDIKIFDRIINTHKSWFDSKFYYTTIRKIKPVNYKGLVYNLEVDKSHSYVSNSATLHNCGDVLQLQIKVEDNKIIDAKFKTFGCAAALATSSMVTEMVKGKTVEEALEISNKAVAEALDGLPPHKLHCSVLAEEALKSAIEDYLKKSKGDKLI